MQRLVNWQRQIPNMLTVSRILMSPVIGLSILNGELGKSIALLAVAGTTDFLDGYLARKYDWKTPIGSVLDPLADKILITTLVGSLCYQSLLPPVLGIVIVGRDIYLASRSLIIRYQMLQSPKTFARFWDTSVSPAEINPSTISKINTGLQLLLMGSTLVVEYAQFGLNLEILQFGVLITSLWSAVDYTLKSRFTRRVPFK